MTITPILDGHGTITHYVAIKQDISARKSLEAQLLRTQRLESVGRLASGIAHDLNNILAPVLLAPTVVRGIVRDPTVDNIMESVEKNAQRGADIVRQLLTFGRGMEAKRVALPMQPLILDLLKLITETFPRDIEIQHELHGQSLLVEGDQTQLHQLLMNLCINARDAMPNGGRLSIGLKQEDVPESKSEVYAWVTAGPHAVLTVRDTGTGIEPDHLDKIFDPFFTTKPPSQGTGLGLSTAIGIVRGDRGFMEVQSRPGQGATFLVYLPLAASTVPPLKKREARDPLIQGNGETILLVDDEDGIRRVLGEILRRNGYQVLLASHGQEAMDLLRNKSGSVHLVLTDLMMPVMDGWALIHEVRNQWPGRPIVAMSGNLPHADWIAQIHPLVNDLLVKPCQAARLLTCLQDVLDNAKS